MYFLNGSLVRFRGEHQPDDGIGEAQGHASNNDGSLLRETGCEYLFLDALADNGSRRRGVPFNDSAFIFWRMKVFSSEYQVARRLRINSFCALFHWAEAWK